MHSLALSRDRESLTIDQLIPVVEKALKENGFERKRDVSGITTFDVYYEKSSQGGVICKYVWDNRDPKPMEGTNIPIKAHIYILGVPENVYQKIYEYLNNNMVHGASIYNLEELKK